MLLLRFTPGLYSLKGSSSKNKKRSQSFHYQSEAKTPQFYP